jgi:4-amino-4-deoxy-L-arabinose transferase-like glycosyltransferase
VLRRLIIGWGLALFAAIAAPWFVLAARANPRFLSFFFVREHFQRFLTPIEHRTEPWWFFAPVLAVGILPWLPQAARASMAPFSGRAPRGQFDPVRLLWIWCVFVLIFFSASDSKLIPYILPAVPALALLCASRKDDDSRGSLPAGALLSLGFVIGVLAYLSGRWGSSEGRELLSLIRPTLTGMCVLLALGALLCLVLARLSRPLAALASLCVAWFLASGAILVAADAAQSLFSAKDVAEALRRRDPAADSSRVPIFAVQSYQQSLPFYLKRSVVLVDYRDEFDLGLTQDPQRGIATLRQFAREWQSLGSGFAVMPPSTQDRLNSLGLPMHELARFPDRVIVGRSE